MSRLPVALCLAAGLLLGGCAARDAAVGENRPGGFYAGAGGGMTRR